MTIEEINSKRKPNCKLTAIAFAERHITKSGKSFPAVKCKCECGKEKIIEIWSITRGLTKSCGCAKKFLRGGKFHPKIKSLNVVWHLMKKRCYDKTAKSYKTYGERGIHICNEWLNNYQSFLDWSLSNGWQKGLQIDRIDNDGNYEPSNCRWVTKKKNCNNRRSCVFITHNNETKSMNEWAEFYKIKWSFLQYRIVRKKMTLQEVLDL